MEARPGPPPRGHPPRGRGRPSAQTPRAQCRLPRPRARPARRPPRRRASLRLRPPSRLPLAARRLGPPPAAAPVGVPRRSRPLVATARCRRAARFPAAPGRRRGRSLRSGRAHSWAELLRRTFAADVLRYPKGRGGRHRVTTISDPLATREILLDLSLSGEPRESAPGVGARMPRATTGFA